MLRFQNHKDLLFEITKSGLSKFKNVGFPTGRGQLLEQGHEACNQGLG